MTPEMKLLNKMTSVGVSIRTFRGIVFLCEYDNAIEKILPEVFESLLEHRLVTPFERSKSVITEEGIEALHKLVEENENL